MFTQKLNWRCLLIALSFITTPAFAITEAQFIEKVLAQDKMLEEAQIGVDIKQIELDASRDNYADWKAELVANTAYKRTDYDKQKRASRSTGFLSTDTYNKQIKSMPSGIGLNVNKRFLSNPGSLSFGVKRNHVDGRDIQYKRTYFKRCDSGKETDPNKCARRSTI